MPSGRTDAAFVTNYALVHDGIVVCPKQVVPNDVLADRWAKRLICAARSDRLLAEKFYFHIDDYMGWECVELLSPSGTQYKYEGSNEWCEGEPDRVSAARRLRPLIERDWGDRLGHARRRAAQACHGIR
jgi:hypothetical protein